MEAVTVAVALTLMPFLLYFIYSKWKAFNDIWKHLKKLPGPKGIPIAGNLFDVMGETEYTFSQVRAFSLLYPLFKLRIFNIRLNVFLYSPEEVEAVLSSMKHISKGDLYEYFHHWLGTGLLTSTGAKWQKRRKILTPAFHFSILNKFLEIFNRETEHLVQVIKEQPSPIVDVVKPITEYTLSSIGETSLGVQINKEPNKNKYTQAIHDYGEAVALKLTRPWLSLPVVRDLFPSNRRNKDAVAVLHNFSTSIIQKRKEQVQTELKGSYSMRKKLALLDLLLRTRYQDDVNMDDEGVREEIDTFMLAGHDTTTASLCFTLMALANEPKIQEDIFQEIMDTLGNKKAPDPTDISNMVYLDRCVKESLRLYPSVPFITRKISEDITTSQGYIIPNNSEVQIYIYALHHNPAVWEDPEKFNPDRFLPENCVGRHPFAYIPFSAGPRNCIGQKYALYEVKAAVCGILKNFKLEPVEKPTDMKYKLDMVLRTNGPIRVKFIPRTSSNN